MIKNELPDDLRNKMIEQLDDPTGQYWKGLLSVIANDIQRGALEDAEMWILNLAMFVKARQSRMIQLAEEEARKKS